MALAPTPQRGVLKRAGSRWRSRNVWFRAAAFVLTGGIGTFLQYRNDRRAIIAEDAERRFYTEQGAERVRNQLENERDFAGEYQRTGAELQVAIAALRGVPLDSEDPAHQDAIHRAQVAIMDFNLAHANYQQGLTQVGTNPTDLELNPDQRIPRRAIRAPLTLENLLQQDESGRQLGLENFVANYDATMREEARLDYARQQLIDIINQRIPVDTDPPNIVYDKRNRLAAQDAAANRAFRDAVRAYQSNAADHTMRVIRTANVDTTTRRAPVAPAPVAGGLPIPPPPPGTTPPAPPAPPAPGAGAYTPPTGRGRRRAHFRGHGDHFRQNPIATTAQVINGLSRERQLSSVDRAVNAAIETYRTYMTRANENAQLANQIFNGVNPGTSFAERQQELDRLQAQLDQDVSNSFTLGSYDYRTTRIEDIKFTQYGDPDNKKDRGVVGRISEAQRGLGRHAETIELSLVINAIRDNEISYDMISTGINEDATTERLAELGLSHSAARKLGQHPSGSEEGQAIITAVRGLSDKAREKGTELAGLRAQSNHLEQARKKAWQEQLDLLTSDPDLAPLLELRKNVAEKREELKQDRETHQQLSESVRADVDSANTAVDEALSRASQARDHVRARNTRAATRAARTGVGSAPTRARQVQASDITQGRSAPTVAPLPVTGPPMPASPPAPAPTPAGSPAPTR
ncbi:MAG: hypothetical protein HOQ05_05615 [Corynebacteriales bacterium]|nr:hypothetical protein [Mycobacteriales bacterium]